MLEGCQQAHQHFLHKASITDKSHNKHLSWWLTWTRRGWHSLCGILWQCNAFATEAHIADWSLCAAHNAGICCRVVAVDAKIAGQCDKQSCRTETGDKLEASQLNQHRSSLSGPALKQ
jgi:hypothetical protein